MIIPISDEAPVCGNPFDADDLHGMDAINPFVANLGVVVYPISATGTSADVIEISKALAEATGGRDEPGRSQAAQRIGTGGSKPFLSQGFGNGEQ